MGIMFQSIEEERIRIALRLKLTNLAVMAVVLWGMLRILDVLFEMTAALKYKSLWKFLDYSPHVMLLLIFLVTIGVSAGVLCVIRWVPLVGAIFLGGELGNILCGRATWVDYPAILLFVLYIVFAFQYMKKVNET